MQKTAPRMCGVICSTGSVKAYTYCSIPENYERHFYPPRKIKIPVSIYYHTRWRRNEHMMALRHIQTLQKQNHVHIVSFRSTNWTYPRKSSTQLFGLRGKRKKIPGYWDAPVSGARYCSYSLLLWSTMLNSQKIENRKSVGAYFCMPTIRPLESNVS
jgi:hypothetical protein